MSNSQALPPLRKQPTQLVMTDYGFLLALALALLFAVDPLEWRLERIALTKHLPLLLILPCVVLTMVGTRIYPRQSRVPSIASWFAPLSLLAAFVTAGSLVARFHLNIQNTFLFGGGYIMVAPITAFMLVHTAAPAKLLQIYVALCVLAGSVVFMGLAVNYGVKQVYHELEYVFPALAAFFAFRQGRKIVKWAGFLFFMATAFLFKKNTGYIAAILVAGYLMVFLVLPRWSKMNRLRQILEAYSTLVLLLVAGAIVTYVLLNREKYLPTGNTEFRNLTYARAWDRFLASPLWGTGFTAAGTEEFTGFDTGVANNVLPTHSDILDILANGGLLGIGLWLWGLLRVAKLAYQNVLATSLTPHQLTPYAHLFACVSIVAVATYAFNPLWLQPAKAILVWASLGFLVGIASLVKKDAMTTKGKV